MTEVGKPRGKWVEKSFDGWTVLMEWAAGADYGGPIRLEIRPQDPDAPPIGGISTTLLRDVIQIAADELRSSPPAQRANAKEATRRRTRLRKALERKVDDEYLALLSAEYIAAINEGREKPNDYLAEMVGKTTSTIRGHLWQARRPPHCVLVGSPGKLGGRLTAKGVEILKRVAPELADA